MEPAGHSGTPYRNVAYLWEHGPSAATKLPTEVAASHRAAGVIAFTIRGGSGTEGISLGKQLRKVYYLDEHSPEEVIKAFIETNSHLLEDASARGLVRRFGGHGAVWREAAREVLEEEFGVSTGENKPESHDEPKPVKCWRCGERVSTLKTHLSESCSG
jgi:hypothetical protein